MIPSKSFRSDVTIFRNGSKNRKTLFCANEFKNTKSNYLSSKEKAISFYCLCNNTWMYNTCYI